MINRTIDLVKMHTFHKCEINLKINLKVQIIIYIIKSHLMIYFIHEILKSAQQDS